MDNITVLRHKYDGWFVKQTTEPSIRYYTEVHGVACSKIPVDLYTEFMQLHIALLDAVKEKSK